MFFFSARRMVQECSFSFNPLVGFRDCVDVAPEPDWWTWLNTLLFTDKEMEVIAYGPIGKSIGIATFVAFLLISVCTRPDRGVLAK